MFARCKLMFGDQQLSVLGDRVEVGLMLAENGLFSVEVSVRCCVSCVQHQIGQARVAMALHLHINSVSVIIKEIIF